MKRIQINIYTWTILDRYNQTPIGELVTYESTIKADIKKYYERLYQRAVEFKLELTEKIKYDIDETIIMEKGKIIEKRKITSE